MLKQKKALFLITAFPTLQKNNNSKFIIPLNGGIELITEEIINNALFSQSIKKAFNINRFNFKAIRLL
jgi:hypothetical protein